MHKITLLSQTYEKPTTRRNRLAEERAYYAKWFYLKYATEVVKFSFKKYVSLQIQVINHDYNYALESVHLIL